MRVSNESFSLNKLTKPDRGVERLKCARMPPKGDERVLENTFGVLMTG